MYDLAANLADSVWVQKALQSVSCSGHVRGVDDLTMYPREAEGGGLD